MKYSKLLIIPSILLSSGYVLAENCPTLDLMLAKQLLDGGTVNGWAIEGVVIDGGNYLLKGIPKFSVVKVSSPLNSVASDSIIVPPNSTTSISVYTCQYDLTTAEKVIGITLGKRRGK